MEIAWIASYPKSGNTWVRFLLYSLLHGAPDKPLDVAQTIPDVHRKIPFEMPEEGPLYAKTHFMLSPQHPRVGESARAVYVVRHPKDILLSGLNYARLAGADESQLTGTQYAKVFLAKFGDPRWIQFGFGTWAQHVRSWLDQDQFPVHVVRYEDLIDDSARELGRIAQFLGLSADEARLEAAAKASSFDALRALEVREKSVPTANPKQKRLFVGGQATAQKGVYFINAGKTGQSLDTIAPGLDDAFDASFGTAHAELLQRFGYNA